MSSLVLQRIHLIFTLQKQNNVPNGQKQQSPEKRQAAPPQYFQRGAPERATVGGTAPQRPSHNQAPFQRGTPGRASATLPRGGEPPRGEISERRVGLPQGHPAGQRDKQLADSRMNGIVLTIFSIDTNANKYHQVQVFSCSINKFNQDYLPVERYDTPSIYCVGEYYAREFSVPFQLVGKVDICSSPTIGVGSASVWYTFSGRSVFIRFICAACNIVTCYIMLAFLI